MADEPRKIKMVTKFSIDEYSINISAEEYKMIMGEAAWQEMFLDDEKGTMNAYEF